ncbi:hypothetical protein [Streptomyces sp. NPDC020298]|uniref:hypothetical protein n=1 Tax=unclassified Streptomyces TaxID=2593676 RepID=UPI0033CDD962
MFLECGFDRVSVNDIAAPAEIAKPTLCQGEAARVVRDRRSGIKPVTAVHRHLAGRLTRYQLADGEALADALGEG